MILKMTKYMACFALFGSIFYKMSSYKIYLSLLIEKLQYPLKYPNENIVILKLV